MIEFVSQFTMHGMNIMKLSFRVPSVIFSFCVSIKAPTLNCALSNGFLKVLKNCNLHRNWYHCETSVFCITTYVKWVRLQTVVVWHGMTQLYILILYCWQTWSWKSETGGRSITWDLRVAAGSTRENYWSAAKGVEGAQWTEPSAVGILQPNKTGPANQAGQGVVTWQIRRTCLVK